MAMYFREFDGINRINLDAGALGSLDFAAIPFLPKRIYWLTDVENGQIRGRHAHKNLSQCFFVMKGSCDLLIRNEIEKFEIHLTADSKLIYIKPGLWRELYNFVDGTVICVIADDIYDEGDYIRDFDDYLAWCKNGD